MNAVSWRLSDLGEVKLAEQRKQQRDQSDADRVVTLERCAEHLIDT